MYCLVLNQVNYIICVTCPLAFFVYLSSIFYFYPWTAIKKKIKSHSNFRVLMSSIATFPWIIPGLFIDPMYFCCMGVSGVFALITIWGKILDITKHRQDFTFHILPGQYTQEDNTRWILSPDPSMVPIENTWINYDKKRIF